jgi:exopolysaccharide biosynthesis polyprenyl glycosylphosphotransferase
MLTSQPSGSLDVEALEDALNAPAPTGSPRPRTRVAAFLAVDFLAAVLSLPLAALLLAGISNHKDNDLANFGTNMRVDALFPVCVLIMLAVAGFYRSNRQIHNTSTFYEIRELSLAVAAGCVLTIGIGIAAESLWGTPQTRNTLLVLAAVVSMVLIPAGRTVLRCLYGGARARVLIVGSGALADRLTTCIALTRSAQLVGRVAGAEAPEPGALGTFADLPELCARLGANEIIVGYPIETSHDYAMILRSLPASVRINIVPRFYELHSWRSKMTDIYGLPLIQVSPNSMTGWDRFAKRLFDLAICIPTLLLTLPIAAVIAIGIKVTSPGPVFFRQERLGRDRTTFTMWKFRSMTVERAERGAEQDAREAGHDVGRPLHELRGKAREQHRVTRIGTFLRKTGLDELPQLLNVLRGDMAIVGPRPFIEEESEHLIGWESRRFEVRPGMTGLWQVSGRNELDMEDLRRLDYLYVASWSFLWDIKIVLETPRAMLRGTGAY